MHLVTTIIAPARDTVLRPVPVHRNKSEYMTLTERRDFPSTLQSTTYKSHHWRRALTTSLPVVVRPAGGASLRARTAGVACAIIGATATDDDGVRQFIEEHRPRPLHTPFGGQFINDADAARDRARSGANRGKIAIARHPSRPAQPQRGVPRNAPIATRPSCACRRMNRYGGSPGPLRKPASLSEKFISQTAEGAALFNRPFGR